MTSVTHTTIGMCKCSYTTICLCMLSFHMFKQPGLTEELHAEEQCHPQKARFLTHMVLNPHGLKPAFCCSIHVPSVVQMTHMLLTHGGLKQSNAASRNHCFSHVWSVTLMICSLCFLAASMWPLWCK